MSAGGAGPVRFIVDESRNLEPVRGVEIAGDEMAAALEEGRRYGLVVIRAANQRPSASP